MRQSPALLLIGLAAGVALLNAVKPLTVDDPAYYAYAAQIARHPLDPYGFVGIDGRPAFQTLAPPLIPYWWAGAIRLFGDEPFLWKLALLPFVLLLVVSLHALLRRFAFGLERPLLVLTVASPAFLPSWNLMLDLPALALTLAAVAVYLRAVDRSAPVLAVLAGLLAGLAMQTKYTGLLAPAVFLLHALVFRRPRYGLPAAVLALLVFTSWEGWVALTYGESHFLHHLRQQQGSPLRRLRLFLPLLGILGGVAPCGALLGLAALGARRRVVLAGGLLLALAYALLALVPGAWQTLWSLEGEGLRLDLAGLLFGTAGAAVGATTLAVAGRLCRPAPGKEGTRAEVSRRADRFLVLWLLLEVAGYFALSPFPAVRRVLGLEVVGGLLAGRLASRTCRDGGRVRLLWGLALANAVLGLGVYGVDLWDARVRRDAADEAARWVRRQEPGATVWFTGGHGFEFYAARAGMRPLLRDTALAPGDWLVTDPARAAVARGLFPDTPPRGTLLLRDRLPLRTLANYYGSGTPLEHLEGPRITVTIYRYEP